MSSTILKRLKYCKRDGYEHLNCYAVNDIQCLLGNTPDEIMAVLDKHFKNDISSLIEDGKTPSVDRIDPTGNYELTNIRIIDVSENVAIGMRNANLPRRKPVRAIFPDGSTKDFEYMRQAEEELGIHHSGIRGLIKRNGKSRKSGIRFEWVNKGESE